MELKIELSPEAKAELSRLSKGKIFRNILTATHKAGTSAALKIKRESVLAVEERKNLSSGFIKSKTTTRRPSPGQEGPSWTVKVDGEALPVAMFGPVQTKHGVSFRANRSHSSLIKGAFIATMNNGHVGVFQRDGRRGMRRVPYTKDGKRNLKTLPIREVYTSGTSSGLKVASVRDSIQEKGSAAFSKTFLRVIKM